MTRTVLQKIYAALQADPQLCRKVAAEMGRQRASADPAAADTAAVAAAAASAVTLLAERLAGIERSIEGIRKADEQRRTLSAMNASAWRNGALHFDPDRFAAAMGGNS